MNTQILSMFERMAETGTAPEDGCGLFGVGYEDAFERLRSTYIERRFQRGGSAEKFVVGPFGSGKTHFLRQLMELARAHGCVTSEIALNKDVDFTKSLTVYRELCREIRTPVGTKRGIESLLREIAGKISAQAINPTQAEVLLKHWIDHLGDEQFELPAFPRIVQRALLAHLDGDAQTFLAAARWIGGEGDDRSLAKELGVAPVTRSEENLVARRSQQSLFQFIRKAGFTGTVVGLDEAEQGWSVNKKKTAQILSMLQSDINATADLTGGSALIMYALTSDLFQKMEEFPALQQRVADPTPGRGFFDGEIYAPKIDLTNRNSSQDLREIGRRLVTLFYEYALELKIPRERLLDTVGQIAERILEEDVGAGNRRSMVKRTCSTLLGAYDTGELGMWEETESAGLDEEI